MNQEELDNLIWAHLDGELEAADQQRLQALLRTSEQVRQKLDEATAMDSLVRASLQTEIPDVTRARLMASLAAESTPPVERTPIWAKKWPAVVAAAALVIAWMAGVFDAEDPAPMPENPSREFAVAHASHTGLLKMVAAKGQQFHASLNTGARAGGLDRVKLKELLSSKATTHEVWPAMSNCKCKTRLKQCSKKVEDSIGRPCDVPDLSRDLQLEAFQIDDFNGVATPHLIMTRGQEEVSVYIFTKEHVKELFACLCRSTEHKVGADMIRGCADCNVVVRCFGEQVLVFISRMQYTELRKLVLDV